MGQPTAGRAAVPRAECIGRAEGTGGTETSQYPEDEESISARLSDWPCEIPGVVASETGAAQTGGALGNQSVGGVVGSHRTAGASLWSPSRSQPVVSAEAAGKRRRRR